MEVHIPSPLSRPPPQLTAKPPQVFHAYTLSTAAYLALQSLPLLLTPRLLVGLLASEPRRTTDVEGYLARSCGLALLALSILLLLQTGVLPAASPSSSPPAADADADGEQRGDGAAGLAYATVVVTTAYHACGAFHLYAQVAAGFTFGFGTGLLASTGLCGMGMWVILFGSDKGRISKRTGADKRTGNFPFTNAESARERKKESRRRSVAAKVR